MTAQYVLVVEDNAMNADILRENLVDAGYTFALAINGVSGVAIANDLLPDIILMDVNLPILDGLAATRLLKKNTTTQGIPVVALTARAMTGDQEMCIAAGCDDYVSKPVDINVLLGKMKHHLDRRPQSFVERIQRQRITVTWNGIGSGMAPRDYEEEFSLLNDTVERLEAELALSRARVTELDLALGEREHQIASVIQDRDRALKDGAARIARLLEERDPLRADRDALRLKRDSLVAERDNLAAGRDPVTAELIRRAAEDVERASQWSQKLAQQLEAAELRNKGLLHQLETIPNDIRGLQTRHDGLRKAFQKLQRSVAKASEEALNHVAFGETV